MLEHGNAQGHREDGPERGVKESTQHALERPSRGLRRRNALKRRPGFGLAGRGSQNGKRLFSFPAELQPARTFRHRPKAQEIGQRRQGLNTEHPAPGREGRGLRKIREHLSDHIVREKGGGNTDHDIQLIDGDEAPSILCRGKLRDIKGGHDERGTNAETTQHARDHQRAVAGRQRRRQGRDKIEGSGQLKGPAAPKGVAEYARPQHGEGGGQGEARNQPTLLKFRQPKAVPHGT